MSGRMVCDAKRIDATLPVTAITVLELGGRRLVLSSCGPSILLIDEKSGHVCSEVRAFKRHNVHGILTTGLRQSQGDHVREIFLAWGGSSLRLLCVSIDRDGSKGNISLSLKSAEHRAHDWILDAGFAVTQEPDAIWVALITAHNVLLALEFEKPFSAGTIELKIRELASGLNSVLYSADIAWVSTTQILVAAGTVFGEIVTWSCFLSPSAYESASTVIHHFFTGHEGSIFGVDISPPLTLFANSKPSRLLASCSDDRTIRIWDISDCSSSRSAVVDPGTGAEHKTGFGNSLSCGDVQVNPEGCICTTFGHISRIWGIKFFDIVSANGTLQVQLVSRGEDATTQIWIGTLRPNPRPESAHAFENDGVLSHVTTREYHSGKNVWSFASIENVDTVDIYSGGADGSIITYPISKIASSPSEDVSQDSVARKQDLSEKPKLNRYNFVSDIHILATSSQGKVFIGTIDNEAQQNDECDQLEVSWELLDIVPGLKDHSVIASNPCTGIAILCGLAGDVFIYGHADRSLKKIAQADQRVAGVYLVANGSPCISCAFVVSYMGRSDAHLFIFPSIDSANAYTTFRLQAPEKFVVTAAEYLQSQNCVVLGGRTGGLCLFNIDNTCTDSPISPSLNLEHVHGKDTVTSVMSLPKESDDSPDQMVLTTGRDGYYSVHRITQSSTSYAVRTIHRSSPPLGSSIEGAYIDLHTNDLILYGFRSTQFTIYNETAQSLVSATECGGAHRTWAFNHSASTEGRMTFAWTRASTFNLSSRVGLIQRSIRIGGHGREIKAMCSSPVVYKINNTPRKIVATGAEDTTIRLFAYVPESHTEKQGCFKCVLTLRKHTTGLQHLQFSPCGNYLFSSGGLEEFYVWRVRCIPGLGLGAVLEATCPKSTPKSDLRITSFDILNINGDETEDAFLVSLTYSNSEVRIFMYTSPTTETSHSFTLVAQGRYKTNCLTYVRFAQLQSQTYLITASTDGHIALWSITSALSRFVRLDDQGHLHKLQSPTYAEDTIITWQSSHRIHQNSIKALDMLSPMLDEPDLQTARFVLVTGGDDNSLAVTSIELPSSGIEYRFNTSYISESKSDHAAAINDLSILPSAPIRTSDEKFNIQFVSSGNDQQLKMFDVSLDFSDNSNPHVEARCCKNTYTPVADVASVGCFKDIDEATDMRSIRVLVCGVGMDLWNLHLQRCDE